LATKLFDILNMLPAPIVRIGGSLLLFGGGLLAVIGSIFLFMATIGKLIKALKELAIAQVVLKAFSGPIGWGQIAIGAGVAAAGVGAIVGLTRFAGGVPSGPSPATVVAAQPVMQRGPSPTVNINAQAFTGSRADARKFGADIQRISRSEQRLGR